MSAHPRRGREDARLSGRLLLVVLGLAFAPAAALGLARFGYALLLPAMLSNLRWSYLQAGALNTANAIGYVFGAMLAAAAGRRFGTGRSIAWSLVIVGASVFLCAATSSLVLLCFLRVVSGVGGGIVYIVGGGVAARVGGRSSTRASKALSIYFAGVGGGILTSGLVVPELIGRGTSHWRLGWVVLGTGTIVGLAAAAAALRFVQTDSDSSFQRPASKSELAVLRPAFWAYGAFGVGYIAYMTFTVALIRHDGGGTSATITFWSVLGASAMLASPTLSSTFTSDRLRGGRAIAAALCVVGVASALPVVSAAPPVLLISAAFFGGSFIAVAALIALLTRTVLPVESVTSALGRLTIVFALGQVIGPLLAGLISDSHAGLRLGLAGSSLVLLLAVPIALRQPAIQLPAPGD